MKKISILIPVRNEIEGLPRLRETVSQLQQKLADQNYETEIVVTDNHSVDGSAAFLEEWANQPSDAIRYFRFARDYGFQTSLMYGMSQAEGDALVVLQSDLQDPPELILEFVSLWESGANVVAGVATNRDESFVSFSTRRDFYWTLDKSSDNTIPLCVPENQLRKHIMRIVTNYQGVEEAKDPDSCTIFSIYKNFATPEQIQALRERYLAGGMGWGHAKQELFELMNEHLSPMRARYDELMANPAEIDRILAEGSAKAREFAKVKIKYLRQVIGME